MKKLDHIGIAVKNLQSSTELFEKLLNSKLYKIEEVVSQQVKTAFIASENCKIELLEALNEESLIHKFIEKKGEGIHHIAFEVDDILKEMNRLKTEGFTLLNEKPTLGADAKLICFLHPKDTNSVLIELCQSIK
jgi:methylmalonyl-CoA/ethylmalonyl-CoA epimerase